MESLEKVLLSPKSLKENGFHPKEATLAVVKDLLSTPKHQRSSKQLTILQVLTRTIKFFTQKSSEIGVPIHLDCCQVMTYSFFPHETNVFEFGQPGDKFFIILEGVVQVIVPIQVEEEIRMLPVAQLQAGMAFGELALLKDQPRAATILCKTDCHFAVIGKSDYMKIIGKAESRILDKQIEFLKEIPFFSKWSKRKLEKLNLYFTLKKFSRKQVVCAHHSPANCVYIVKSGEFELTKPLLVEKEKNFNVKVALLTRGEMFGEAEVISKGLFSTTCTCYSTEGELLCLSADIFLLKFYQKSDAVDDIGRKIKYEIRENRFQGFKSFYEGSPGKRKGFDNSITPELKAVGKIQKNLKKSNGTRFSPLNEKQLEKVKSRALGVSLRDRLYIGITTPYESVPTEESEKIMSPTNSIFRSFREMVSHRPGGYYSGRLRRVRIRHLSQNMNEKDF